MDHILRLPRRALRAVLGLTTLLHTACAYDFGDCDAERVGDLPASDPLDVRTGAYVYTVTGLSQRACLSCGSDCEIDIESAFATANEPRSLDLLCGPMWLDGTCAFIGSITDPVTDTADPGPGRPFRAHRSPS